jgi:DNA segregation ATPase FtsK/SpoIIIE-like protein
MFSEAVELVRETGMASASFFQRHLKVGYARAASILDELERGGLIGPVNGAYPREIFLDNQKPRPEFVEEEINLIKWVKTNFAKNKSENFEIEIGKDENNKVVKLDLEKYGNLLVIGSQFTSAVDFLNSILAKGMATYSPDELRVILIDGVGGDLIVPNKSPHLLTQIISASDKVISALKWTVSEANRRYKTIAEVGAVDFADFNRTIGCKPMANILIVINGFNQFMSFSSSEIIDNLYKIITSGKKYGVYLIIATDFPNPRTSKEIMANSPAKLVFKSTDKKISRETGIVETFDLKSPDDAIFETMYEGKTKVVIDKVDSKKIFEEIYK